MRDLWDEAEEQFEAKLEHALALQQLIATHELEMREWRKARRAVDFAIRRARRAQRLAVHAGSVLELACRLVAADGASTQGMLQGLEAGKHR